MIGGSRTSSTFFEALKRDELRRPSFFTCGEALDSLLIGTGGGGPWGAPCDGPSAWCCSCAPVATAPAAGPPAGVGAAS